MTKYYNTIILPRYEDLEKYYTSTKDSLQIDSVNKEIRVIYSGLCCSGIYQHAFYHFYRNEFAFGTCFLNKDGFCGLERSPTAIKGLRYVCL